MIVTAEISLYPLQEGYETAIISFIQRIRAYRGLKVNVSSTSTRLVGPYELVMDAIRRELEITFREAGSRVLVAKFINSDLSEDPQDL
jgi:uncharacterized protein YqgV (UPF0045/DUF77 family)